MPAANSKTTRYQGPPADSYDQLVAVLPPRPLHDTIDYDNAVEMVGNLVGYELNADQEDYLEAIVTFVEVYEAQHPETQVDVSHVTGIRLLKMLLGEHDMNAGDLANLLGVDGSLVSRIFNGKRSITWDHAKTLAERFGLPPQTFMD